MARSLKTAGIRELNQLRARARRQHALRRITQTDAQYVCELIDLIEARIVTMHELDETGSEEGSQEWP